MTVKLSSDALFRKVLTHFRIEMPLCSSMQYACPYLDFLAFFFTVDQNNFGNKVPIFQIFIQATKTFPFMHAIKDFFFMNNQQKSSSNVM